jgi:hypothetical protein
MCLQRVRNHSLTSLCLLTHHPFFSIFRECLFILKRLIDACNESSSPKRVGSSRQLSRWARNKQLFLIQFTLCCKNEITHPLRYFVTSVWNLLTGKGVMDSTASVILHDVKEIETWILRLLSAPVPVPGKTRVEVRPKYT